MANPSSVKKQAEQATKLQKELIDGSAPAPDKEQKQPPVESPAPGESNPDLNQKIDLEIPAPDLSKDKVPQDDWKERFARYKASTDAELHRLRTEQPDTVAAAVQKALAEERSKHEQEMAQQHEAESNKITDDEIEEYGPELIGLIQKASKSELAKDLLDLRSRMDRLEQGQSNVVEKTQKTQKQLFFENLSRDVPNWRAHNNDSRFNEWLDTEMPGTGHTRRSFLDTAYEDGDAVRVASFFTSWESRSAPSGKPRIDQHIQPDNSRASGDGYVPEQKTYTGAEVSAFYRDKREGKYRGREEEARRIESDIILAGQQGRVI